jgi:alginate O-acetyltransferase complex protein AlgI
MFVAFFPQLAAGPIVRAVEFLPQMTTPPRVTAQHVSEGLHYFLMGLFKKVFIADQLDVFFVTPVFSDPAAYDAATHRWACLAWAAQIYCDFSGYSDIAIGCGKWFGFNLPRNFNFPYLATSIADFWRRWHLSLSTWLRDYLYFPLGGSKRGELRTNLNLMFVFVMCGLWHGATWAWLVYGLYNGTLMCLHRAFERLARTQPTLEAIRATVLWKVLSWAVTLQIVAAGLVLIRMPDWSAGVIMLHSLFAFDLLSTWSASIPIWVPVLIASVVIGHLVSGMRNRVCAILEMPASVRAVAYTMSIALLVTLSPGVNKTFIYIQF